jgi:hypothetical protein
MPLDDATNRSYTAAPSTDKLPPTGCTLWEYAQAKRLPPHFLQQEFGITEAEGYVNADRSRLMPYLRIPYFAPYTRDRTVAERRRLSLTGGRRFEWRKHDRAYLYGTEALVDIRQAGYVFLVEGESDCHTLRFHRQPVLGLPGNQCWNEADYVPLFDDIPYIYAVIEPGVSGDGMLKWISKSAIRDRVRLIRFAPAIKDVSGLHLSVDGDHERFIDLLDTAYQHAEPFNKLPRHDSDELWRPMVRLFNYKADGSFDHSKLKPRKWVLETLAPRGMVTLMPAQSGTGKTRICVAMAMSVASGSDLLGLKVYGGGGDAAYIYLEDDESDLEIVIQATAEHHKLHPKTFDRALHIVGNRPNRPAWRQFVVAKRDRHGEVKVEPIVLSLIDKLKSDQVRLLVVDPFRYTHELDANDNDKMSRVLGVWSEVARRADCAIILVHHFNKGSGQGVERSSGANAVVDHARAAIPLAKMTNDEAERLAADDRPGRNVRMDDPKLNWQRPPNETVWFHLANVILDVGGDNEPIEVGVAERWYPSAAPIAPMSDELRAVANAGLGDGEYYTRHKTTKEPKRWFGSVVMGHSKVNERHATRLIEAWLQDGTLREELYKSKPYAVS